MWGRKRSPPHPSSTSVPHQEREADGGQKPDPNRAPFPNGQGSCALKALTYIHTHINTHAHIYMHACTCTHIDMDTQTHTYAQSHTHRSTHAHTHMHTYTGMHTHTHLHRHAHTHTAQRGSVLSCLGLPLKLALFCLPSCPSHGRCPSHLVLSSVASAVWLWVDLTLRAGTSSAAAWSPSPAIWLLFRAPIMAGPAQTQPRRLRAHCLGGPAHRHAPSWGPECPAQAT